jgi:hypothetical protein
MLGDHVDPVSSDGSPLSGPFGFFFLVVYKKLPKKKKRKTMGVRNLTCFIVTNIALVFAIVYLALSAAMCDRLASYCFSSSSLLQGVAITGIIGASFAILTCILADLWLIIEAMWSRGFWRIVILIGYALAFIFSFESAFIFASLSGASSSSNIASGVFGFFTSIMVVAAAILSAKA